jgi:hypothetical protein
MHESVANEPTNTCSLPMTRGEEIDEIFVHHSSKPNQTPRYEAIRSQARVLAHFIAQNTPSSREQSIAITKLQEVVMFANAAIAIHE